MTMYVTSSTGAHTQQTLLTDGQEDSLQVHLKDHNADTQGEEKTDAKAQETFQLQAKDIQTLARLETAWKTGDAQTQKLLLEKVAAIMGGTLPDASQTKLGNTKLKIDQVSHQIPTIQEEAIAVAKDGAEVLARTKATLGLIRDPKELEKAKTEDVVLKEHIAHYGEAHDTAIDQLKLIEIQLDRLQKLEARLQNRHTGIAQNSNANNEQLQAQMRKEIEQMSANLEKNKQEELKQIADTRQKLVEQKNNIQAMFKLAAEEVGIATEKLEGWRVFSAPRPQVPAFDRAYLVKKLDIEEKELVEETKGT